MTEPKRLGMIGAGMERIWGLSSAERIRRLSRAAGLETERDPRAADIIVDAGFLFDPAWLDYVIENPGIATTWQGRPVLAHVTTRAQGAAIAAGTIPQTLRPMAAEQTEIANRALRKRERPYLLPLTADNRAEAERASYRGAYKGVTDLLTKYLWPELAFHLTRLAAALGLSPNMVTAIGFVFCVGAGLAFYDGQYGWGMAAGFASMVLDTVDGKLARCTITSSRFGNAFDHGIDLIHPPLWWWAWGAGLTAYGRPLAESTAETAWIAILASYGLQRVIEGIFIAAFAMHIHVWRPLDSRFRLITARRNPNMALLLLFLAIGRPDWGFLALAGWSLFSLAFHFVRLLQAMVVRWQGRDIDSWLHQAGNS